MAVDVRRIYAHHKFKLMCNKERYAPVNKKTIISVLNCNNRINSVTIDTDNDVNAVF